MEYIDYIIVRMADRVIRKRLGSSRKFLQYYCSSHHESVVFSFPFIADRRAAYSRQRFYIPICTPRSDGRFRLLSTSRACTGAFLKLTDRQYSLPMNIQKARSCVASFLPYDFQGTRLVYMVHHVILILPINV